MYTRKGFTIIAPLLIMFGVSGLIIVQLHNIKFGQAGNSLWFGVLTSLTVTFLIGLASYRKTKRGFSAKDIHNITKTIKGLQLWWLWTSIGILIASLFNRYEFSITPSNFFFGAFLGFMTFMGMLVLVDNLSLRSIFLWNSSDKRVQKIWKQWKD
jgi:hypothetical protein